MKDSIWQMMHLSFGSYMNVEVVDVSGGGKVIYKKRGRDAAPDLS